MEYVRNEYERSLLISELTINKLVSGIFHIILVKPMSPEVALIYSNIKMLKRTLQSIAM